MTCDFFDRGGRMRRSLITAIAIGCAAALAACGPRAGTLDAANETLGSAQINSIEFSGSGRWYQFGQAPNPTLPWPQFDVSRYTAVINYTTPAARVKAWTMGSKEYVASAGASSVCV
jgi:hypothetical protein